MANAPSVLNGSVGFGGQNQKPDSAAERPRIGYSSAGVTTSI